MQNYSPDDFYRATVYDTVGDKVGKVQQVYLDDSTGQPSWVTVNTGFFGMNESLVPLEGAQLTDDVLKVPFDKQTIKDAPNFDPGHHLEESDEDELHRYYAAGFGDRDHDLIDQNRGHRDGDLGAAGLGDRDHDLTDRQRGLDDPDRGHLVDQDRGHREGDLSAAGTAAPGAHSRADAGYDADRERDFGRVGDHEGGRAHGRDRGDGGADGGAGIPSGEPLVQPRVRHHDQRDDRDVDEAPRSSSEDSGDERRLLRRERELLDRERALLERDRELLEREQRTRPRLRRHDRGHGGVSA